MIASQLRCGRPVTPSTGLPHLFWLLAFGLLSLWIADRLGAFELWSSVPTANGTTVRVANTFATVDHPFHATRAETFLRSLGDGEMLRWIANHQGGYPAEFYPLGAAGLEVASWAVALGSLPMLLIHKIVVIGILLFPAVGFAQLAKIDRLPIGIAFLATAFHLSVRGWWWSGGYMELVEWGLVTNVLASYMLLVVLGLLHQTIATGKLRFAGLGALATAFSLYTNIRSAIPLVAIVVGTGIVHLASSRNRKAWGDAFSAALVSGLITLLLAAPLIIPLIRFSNLYYFVRYSGYENISDYWISSLQAVSSPVMILAVIGVIGSVFAARGSVVQSVTATLVVYILITIAATGNWLAAGQVEQLEATRLMPFQRLLTIYLAAIGAYFLIIHISRLLNAAGGVSVDATLGAFAVLTLFAYVVLDLPGIPESDRGLVPVATTGQESFKVLESSIRLADQEAASGTSILVLGSVISWHDQLWAPQWSDRQFYYDDWLWYWQTDHVGDYDPLVEHAYDDDASTLSADYLAQHGIGAVVVTGSVAAVAASSPLLVPQSIGVYSVYLVRDPTTIATSPIGNSESSVVENQRLVADFEPSVSNATARRNWFPRWQTSVEDQPATVSKNPAGYMDISSATQGSRVTLSYRIDTLDWLGRALCVAGLLGAIWSVAFPERLASLLQRITNSKHARPVECTVG